AFPGVSVGRYWIGCSGWAYDDWVGPFYPRGSAPGDFLTRYARVFRVVEVDSSFYRAPSPFLVRRWAERTPEGFRFALKVPRDVTHEAGSTDVHKVLDPFISSLEPLRSRGKLGPVVLQFPPSFHAASGKARLDLLLGAIPREYALAVDGLHALRARRTKGGAGLVRRSRDPASRVGHRRLPLRPVHRRPGAHAVRPHSEGRATRDRLYEGPARERGTRGRYGLRVCEQPLHGIRTGDGRGHLRGAGRAQPRPRGCGSRSGPEPAGCGTRGPDELTAISAREP